MWNKEVRSCCLRECGHRVLSDEIDQYIYSIGQFYLNLVSVKKKKSIFTGYLMESGGLYKVVIGYPLTRKQSEFFKKPTTKW